MEPPRGSAAVRTSRGGLAAPSAPWWARTLQDPPTANGRLLRDLVVVAVASVGVAVARGDVGVLQVALTVLYPPLVVSLLAGRGTYRARVRAVALDRLGRTTGACASAAIAMLGVLAVLDAPQAVVHSVVATCVLAAAALTVSSVMATAGQRRVRRAVPGAPTLIVGAGDVGVRIADRLREHPDYGLAPVGYLDSAPRAGAGADEPARVLGGPQDLDVILREHAIRNVVFAFSTTPDGEHVSMVRRCKQLGVDVWIVPRLFDVITRDADVQHIGGLPVLTTGGVDPDGWRFWLKHVLDRVVAAGLVLVSSPLALAIALAIKVESPGPVLFRQRRVGRDGREFDLLKFRSMHVAETVPVAFMPPAGFAPGGVEGRDRRTAIGRILRRLSLDELPQLWNVLRGEMSLVGPRPERPEFVAIFGRELPRYAERHRVRAGITGWAQIRGLRGQTSLAERIEWDNHYIENWSLRLDLRILFMTVISFLRRPGD